MGRGADTSPDDSRMFSEASEAPLRIADQFAKNEALTTKLGEKLRGISPRAVVTIARGSSDNAATYARYLIETKTATLTSSAAPSISSVYIAQPKLDGTVVLAISQSGQSPDLLSSVETAKKAGAFTIAMVNAEDSPLSRLADEVVPLYAGKESSIAATKSYLASVAAILHLVAEWSVDQPLQTAIKNLPELLEASWRLDWSAGAKKLGDARELYVIGRGLGFGLAQEAALKLKETCGLHAEAFSAAEVRHGPMALVGPGFPILMFSQADGTRAGIEALAANLGEAGASIVAAGIRDSHATNLAIIDAHAAVQPILMAQSLYRMVCTLSSLRGYDADNPPHLRKVTETT